MNRPLPPPSRIVSELFGETAESKAATAAWREANQTAQADESDCGSSKIPNTKCS